MIYSWNSERWVKILARIDRMPHALLLAGPRGGGKAAFAEALAARLLCEKAVGQSEACGTCFSCNWISGGNHPDFRLVEPGGDDQGETGSEMESVPQKKKSEQIRIHQIRALDDFLAIGTHRHGARVVIIRPAEAMNQATANSLLKVLEEPSSSTLFILITNSKRKLLPTILSRCQVVDFTKPTATDAMDLLRKYNTKHAEALLAHAGGMPLAAVDEVLDSERLEVFLNDLMHLDQADPMTVAGRWESWLKENGEGKSALERNTLVIWLQKWLFDLILMKMCGATIFHTHQRQEIRVVAGQASIPALIGCYNDLLRTRAISQHPLNPRLFLEDMLARYSRAALSGR